MPESSAYAGKRRDAMLAIVMASDRSTEEQLDELCTFVERELESAYVRGRYDGARFGAQRSAVTPEELAAMPREKRAWYTSRGMPLRYASARQAGLLGRTPSEEGKTQ